MSRRLFLKGAVLAACAALPVQRRSWALTRQHPVWTMIIDRNRCTGCQACVVSCKAQSRSAENKFNTTVREVAGEDGRFHFEPALCNHCDPAPCVAVCPQKAAVKLENGIVVTDWDRCTSDGACVRACPHGARYLDPRFDNRADKCDFCLDRLKKGLQPACVESCPPHARLFGDASAPEGEFAEQLRQGNLQPNKPELGLKTRVLYVPLQRRRKQG
jgi:tetrathionate reductase subunit B